MKTGSWLFMCAITFPRRKLIFDPTLKLLISLIVISLSTLSMGKDLNLLARLPQCLRSFCHSTWFTVSEANKLGALHLMFSCFSGQEKLHIRPSDEFELSDSSLDWRTIDLNEDESTRGGLCSSSARQTVKLLTLTCAKKSALTKRFNVKVRAEKTSVLYEDTGRLNEPESCIYRVKLIPFVRLKNLLPYSVEIKYHPVEVELIKLQPGEETILSYAIFGSTRRF